jgi:integrase
MEEGPDSFRDAARKRREIVVAASLKSPKSYISSLEGYAKFIGRCVGALEFPLDEELFLDYLAMANSGDTANTHVSAMKKACRLLRTPYNVRDEDVRDVKAGLRRLGKGKKRKTCAFSLDLLFRIFEIAKPEYRRLFKWAFVFALRIGEARVLQKGKAALFKKEELPLGRKSAVAAVKREVRVMLDSRKNALEGDTVVRPCLCGPNVNSKWSALCPVHVLLPEFAELEDGEGFFEHLDYLSILEELKRCCGELKVELPAPVGTHSLRRSAIQLMEEAGAENFSKLGLLGIGNHGSKAVNDYRDKKAAEAAIFRTAVYCVEVEGDD